MPYWLTARRAGHCSKCHREIRRGSRIFYYPTTRTVLCAGEHCGEQASREADAARFDERGY